MLRVVRGEDAQNQPFEGAPRTTRLKGNGIRFGMVTDAHYADVVPVNGRHYGESLAKMRECVERLAAESLDFLVELGDLKDQDPEPMRERTLGYLGRIEAEFRRFPGPVYHVLGNHDVDSISKRDFLAHTHSPGLTPDRTFCEFTHGGVTFIVLDANFRSDGTAYDAGNFDWADANIPAAQIAWLRETLTKAVAPVVVFVHQQLDGDGPHTVRNAGQVRSVLELSGKVLAVFQGHNHSGACTRIGGILYYTLPAQCKGAGAENNAYAVVEIGAASRLEIRGFRKAPSL